MDNSRKRIKKLRLIKDVYFKACVGRLQPLLKDDCYSPWMSSVALVELFLQSNGASFDLPSPPTTKILSDHASLIFIKERLGDLQSLDAIKGLEGLDILLDVEARPKSQMIFIQALSLTERWPKWQKMLFDELAVSIVPIYSQSKNSEVGNAFSDHNLVGAIFASVDWRFPYPDLDLTISFAHELGHQALMLYQQSSDLFLNSQDWTYSGVRKTARPGETFQRVSACVRSR